MSYMFAYTKVFNSDLSKWQTSKVLKMDSMFEHSMFNGDITTWDTGMAS